MARVVFGQGVADLSGRIGGTIFSKNSSGNYARNISTIPYKTTFRRVNNVPDLAKYTRLWYGLDFSERVLWNDFAKNHVWYDSWNKASKPTGYNAFVSVNFNRERTGSSVLTLPPAWIIPPQIVSGFITFHNNNWLLDNVQPLDHQNSHFVLMVTNPFPLGSIYIKNKLRLIAIFLLNTSVPKNITPFLSAYFGFPFPKGSDGQNFFLSVGLHIYYINRTSGLCGLGRTYVYPEP